MTPERKQKAFSLIEILLALALVAVLGGLFVVNYDKLLGSVGQRSPEITLYGAIREARYQAANRYTEVLLSYDAKEQEFQIKDLSGNEIATIKTPSAYRLELTSIPPLEYSTGGFSEKEKPEEVSSIHFHPDASASPVRIALHTEESEDLFLEMDGLSMNLTAVSTR